MDHLKPSWPIGEGAPEFTWENVVLGKGVSLDLVVVKQDVGMKVVSYILEHIQSFPGVETPSELPALVPAGRDGGAAARPPRRGLRRPARDAALQGLQRRRRGRLRRPRVHLRQVAARPRRRRAHRGRRVRPAQADRPGRRPHAGPGRHARHDPRLQGPGGRRAGAADRHLSGAQRQGVRGQRRRGRRARRHERRRPRHGELPDLRPRAVGGRHQHQGLQEAHARSRPTTPCSTAADHGDQGGGLHVQGRDLHRRAGGGRDQLGDDRVVPRLLQLAQRPRRPAAEVQLLGDGRARHPRPDRRHHAVVRRVLLQRRERLL